MDQNRTSSIPAVDPSETTIYSLLLEADDLLRVSINAANKLNASMLRYEIEPCAEFERIVQRRDQIYNWLRECRALIDGDAKLSSTKAPSTPSV